MDLRIEPTATGVTAHGPGFSVPLSWRWLRDHGDDEHSRDPITGQRRVDTFSIDSSVAGVVTVTTEWLRIDWPDGAPSELDLTRLAPICAVHGPPEATDTPSVSGPPVLSIASEAEPWDDGSGDSPAPVDRTAFLTTDDALAAAIGQLTRDGYVVLRATDHDATGATDATGAAVDTVVDHALAAAVAERIGYVRHTIFGGIWDLAPDLTEHADTSYSSVELLPHTDGTYSHDAPGLQFLLCRTAANRGGQSVLVDGFAIAAEMARDEPERAATLATVAVPGQYLEPGVHLRAERPPFRVDRTGTLRQVSFNNYDRAPFLLTPDDEERFYAAYGALAARVADRDRWRLITLEAGDAVVFDNWRLLHGRTSFDGHRHYIGGYLNHEDFESTRRVLASSLVRSAVDHS